MKKKFIECSEEKMLQFFDMVGLCEGDCNIDSFQCINLISLIEEEFNIEIPIEYFHQSLLSNSVEVCKIVNAIQEGRKKKCRRL